MYREYQQQNPVLPEQSNVPLCDRVTHMEGMVLSFVAEHNLPFAMANNVVELANEATSLTHHKVLTLLVSYFCHLKKQIVVEHLTSLNLPIVNSLKFYDAVETFFRSNELPWNHLLSTLIDSSGVMRGVKNGFETKLRDLSCTEFTRCRRRCLPSYS